MCLSSVSDIKIQHHTDLRGHRGVLGQMFIIILKLLSLNSIGNYKFYFCACHWLLCKTVLLKTSEHKGHKSRSV